MKQYKLIILLTVLMSMVGVRAMAFGIYLADAVRIINYYVSEVSSLAPQMEPEQLDPQ